MRYKSVNIHFIVGLILFFFIINAPVQAARQEELLIALKAELDKLGFVIYEPFYSENTVFGDFNLDGKEDLAVVVGNPLEEFDSVDFRCVLWIASLNAESQLQILFEWDGFSLFDSFTLSSYKHIDPQIGREVDFLAYDSSFSGNAAETERSVTFSYYENLFSPVYLERSTWAWRGEGSSEESWDFEEFYATYCHNHDISLDEENYFVDGGLREYYFFVPRKVEKIIVDGKLDTAWQGVAKVYVEKPLLIYGADRWNDISDAGLQIRIALSLEYLYIFAEVTDDQVVWSEKPSLKQDHLEIWIDPNNDLTEWDEELDTFRYRHDKKGLYQLGVYQSGVEQYLPKEKPANSVQSKMVQTKTGFLAEIAIPLKDFELEKAKWIDKFGFTLVFSDTDSAEKPAQDTLLATSLLEWGNAYTLGEIWLDLEYFKDFHFYLLDSVWDDRRFYY